MNPLAVIEAKRRHIERLANSRGAGGEASVLAEMAHWAPRPKGRGLKILLGELEAVGIRIKGSSFDAVAFQSDVKVNFEDAAAVKEALPLMTFIEIKTASQSRVKEGFGGFFFTLTEAEIAASEALGERHRIALFNKLSGELQLTSVPDILARSKSMNWQLSVQL